MVVQKINPVFTNYISCSAFLEYTKMLLQITNLPNRHLLMTKCIYHLHS